MHVNEDDIKVICMPNIDILLNLSAKKVLEKQYLVLGSYFA
jgi:hypothetical protein